MRLLFLFILLLPLVSANIIITEIMPHPEHETLNEWIEIYNNSTSAINLENWTIGDKKENDTIVGGVYNNQGTIIKPFSYAIITDFTTRVYNNFNVSENVLRLYIEDNSIGNSLNNQEDTLYLYDNNKNLVSKISYNKTRLNISLVIFNNSLLESIPTPGFSDENKLRLGCDFKVEIIQDDTVIKGRFQWKIIVTKIYGEKTNIELNRRIEDSFSNIQKNYKELKLKGVAKRRTITYNTELNDNHVYVLYANISAECDFNPENNYFIKNIFVDKNPVEEKSFIRIKKILDLGNDNKAKWGQTIRVSIDAYRGNTNKEVIEVFIKNASKTHKINLENKYRNYSITMPLQIKPNCNKNLKNGNYKLQIKGLNKTDSIPIFIENISKDVCLDKELKYVVDNPMVKEDSFIINIKVINELDKDITINAWSYFRGSYNEDNIQMIKVSSKSSVSFELENKVDNGGVLKVKILEKSKKTPKEFSFNVQPLKNESNLNNQMTAKIIYQSKEVKSKRLAVFFFCGLLILVIASLMVEKWKA